MFQLNETTWVEHFEQLEQGLNEPRRLLLAASQLSGYVANNLSVWMDIATAPLPELLVGSANTGNCPNYNRSPYFFVHVVATNYASI